MGVRQSTQQQGGTAVVSNQALSSATTTPSHRPSNRSARPIASTVQNSARREVGPSNGTSSTPTSSNAGPSAMTNASSSRLLRELMCAGDHPTTTGRSGGGESGHNRARRSFSTTVLPPVESTGSGSRRRARIGSSHQQQQDSENDSSGDFDALFEALDRIFSARGGRRHLGLSGLRGARPAHARLPSGQYFQFLLGRDMTCPVCNKMVPSDEAETHLVMCMTRPKITYNDDVLTEDKGECVICFEDMSAGETIARLPCLCIYHKSCIDNWFRKKNCCPEHPGDD